ncbi:hypothetical protein BDZ91DRAFT_833247 [Kalaharituber pfeilii]|nr:hypothetical protein BDZ91DRAFT_833247 [Kalaharituber pfeilii]
MSFCVSKYKTTELVFFPSSITMDFFRSHLMPLVLPIFLLEASNHLLTFPKSFLRAIPWMTMPCLVVVLSWLVGECRLALGHGGNVWGRGGDVWEQGPGAGVGVDGGSVLAVGVFSLGGAARVSTGRVLGGWLLSFALLVSPGWCFWHLCGGNGTDSHSFGWWGGSGCHVYSGGGRAKLQRLWRRRDESRLYCSNWAEPQFFSGQTGLRGAEEVSSGGRGTDPRRDGCSWSSPKDYHLVFGLSKG